MSKYALFLLVACSPTLDQTESAREQAAPVGGDLRHVALWMDVANYTGRARYDMGSSQLAEVWLEVNELLVDAVTDDVGNALDHLIEGTHLVVPAQGATTTFNVAFGFRDASVNPSHRGYSAQDNAATTWPNNCSSLYPCHSRPGDGMRYSLEVVGKPAVYMPALPFDAPGYMLSFTTGHFHIIEAYAPTEAGTQVRYYLKGDPTADDQAALDQVRNAFDWYERTLGPYQYGDMVAGVGVSSPVGCMETHPFWECLNNDPHTNRHEAAHGWFGNAVRIACWEDIFISEGITEYLSQRVANALANDDTNLDLEDVNANPGHNKVWVPEQCSLEKPNNQWMGAYTKGPNFLKEVAGQVGVRALDDLLARFYAQQMGKATRTQDFLDFLRVDAGFEAAPLAEKWLR